MMYLKSCSALSGLEYPCLVCEYIFDLSGCASFRDLHERKIVYTELNDDFMELVREAYLKNE